MRYAEAQLFARFAHLLRCHAEVVSGSYRLRKTECGDSLSPTGWRELTDDEKLADRMAELRRHETLVQEQVDYIEEMKEET